MLANMDTVAFALCSPRRKHLLSRSANTSWAKPAVRLRSTWASRIVDGLPFLHSWQPGSPEHRCLVGTRAVEIGVRQRVLVLIIATDIGYGPNVIAGKRMFTWSQL